MNSSNTSYILCEINHQQMKPSVKVTVDDLNEWPLPTPAEYMENKSHTLAINAAPGNLGHGNDYLWGMAIVDGNVVFERAFYNHTLGIKDADGRLVSYKPEVTAQQIIDDGCSNAVSGFVPLIINNRIVDNQVLDDATPGHAFTKEPRQVIGQKQNGNYLIMTVSGRQEYGEGMTLNDCARVMKEHKAKFAYNLDGGGSTHTVVNTRQNETKSISKKIFETNRGIRTIIVFDEI